VTALVSATNGAVTANYEYGPFGELIRATGPTAKLNQVMYQSQINDWESGKYYWKYRYYDTGTGRWLSRDPIGENGGFNLYLFNYNNTINKIDPFGLIEDDDNEFDPKDDEVTRIEGGFSPGQQRPGTVCPGRVIYRPRRIPGDLDINNEFNHWDPIPEIDSNDWPSISDPTKPPSWLTPMAVMTNFQIYFSFITNGMMATSSPPAPPAAPPTFPANYAPPCSLCVVNGLPSIPPPTTSY
jgi:RHS repeat-associated protein